jgi:hypothetical protein
MNKVLFLFFLACVFYSCKKDAAILTSKTSKDSTKIISISSNEDTSANFFYSYTNNRVTDIYWFYQNLLDSFHYAHLDYLGDNYIKVTDPKNELRYTEYYLTDLKLPLTIIKHPDILDEKEIINFYYKQGTNLLDSINDSLTNGYYSMHYDFNYEGENISKILITGSYSGGSGEYSLNYTYDTSTPNIFRYTDSLLYVYTDPFAQQISTTYIPQNFFANTFSASTFRTISYTGNPFNYAATISYILNYNGKISSIGYNGYLGSTYSYK